MKISALITINFQIYLYAIKIYRYYRLPVFQRATVNAFTKLAPQFFLAQVWKTQSLQKVRNFTEYLA